VSISSFGSNVLLCLIVFFLPFKVSNLLQAQSRFFVDSDIAAPGDGATWNTAFRDLKTAISEAAPNDEIWVKNGNYKPTNGTDRTQSFLLQKPLRIYGGFRGDETLLQQRNLNTSASFLDGDIGITGIDGDNSFNIVLLRNVSGIVILDGFTFINGNANEATENALTNRIRRNGAAIHAYNDVQAVTGATQLTVANCSFQNNFALRNGAGIFTGSEGPNGIRVLIENNQFEDNALGNYFVQNDNAGGIDIQLEGIENAALSVVRQNQFRGATAGNNSVKFVNSRFENTQIEFSNNSWTTQNITALVVDTELRSRVEIHNNGFRNCRSVFRISDFSKASDFVFNNNLTENCGGPGRILMLFGSYNLSSPGSGSFFMDGNTFRNNNCRNIAFIYQDFPTYSFSNNSFCNNQAESIYLINKQLANVLNFDEVHSFNFINEVFRDNIGRLLTGALNDGFENQQFNFVNCSFYNNRNSGTAMTGTPRHNDFVYIEKLESPSESQPIVRFYNCLFEFNNFNYANLLRTVNLRAEFNNNLFNDMNISQAITATGGSAPTVEESFFYRSNFIPTADCAVSLNPCSFAVDNGNEALLASFGEFLWDNNGNPRILDGGLDIGAVESVDMFEAEILIDGCDRSTGSIFFGTFGSLPNSYSWQRNGQSGSNTANLTPGEYVFTITDADNCSIEFEVIIPELIEISGDLGSGQFVLCEDESLALDFSGRGVELRWSNGVQGPAVLLDEQGEYVVTVSDVCGEYDLFFDIRKIIPVDSAENVVVCEGLVYAWQGQNLDSPGLYISTLQSAKGCDSIYITLDLDFQPGDKYFEVIMPDEIALGDLLEILVDTDIENLQNLQIDPMVELLQTDLNSFAFNAANTNRYTFIISDEDGCIYFDTVSLRLIIDKEFTLNNVLSPNAPLPNNLLVMRTGIATRNVECTIFDRWGSIVHRYNNTFLSSGVHEIWDSSGTNLLPGVYVYHVRVDTDLGEIVQTGDFTLVR
jgi:hypothetical protein